MGGSEGASQTSLESRWMRMCVGVLGGGGQRQRWDSVREGNKLEETGAWPGVAGRVQMPFRESPGGAAALANVEPKHPQVLTRKAERMS